MSEKDWQAWHNGYDQEVALAERLEIVRHQLTDCLPAHPTEPYKILDLCAGDARDLAPVLVEYAHPESIQVLAIEIDQTLATKAQSALGSLGLGKIEVIQGDASRPDSFKNFVPVDLVMLCGIFGNISDEDIDYTIDSLPQFCKTNSQVIWTRNRRSPDITPDIRRHSMDNGFVEIDFVAPEDNQRKIAVGRHKYTGLTEALKTGMKLFSFNK